MPQIQSKKICHPLPTKGHSWARSTLENLRKNKRENTKFFHASASQHFQNTINLQSQGVEFHSHEQKAQFLKDYFTAMIGSPLAIHWNFTLDSFYPQQLTQL